MRRLNIVLVLLCLAGLAGCGGDDDDSDASASAPGSTEDTASTDGADGGGDLGPGQLAVAGFEFVLQPVPAGSQVEFANLDSAPHTLTASDGAFDTGSVTGGESATFTAPADAGSYDVICTIHPNITGTLEVAAAG